MSRNCHKGHRLTRRDDLESIMYIIIRCVNATLPWWNNHTTGNKDVNSVLCEMKEKHWGSQLCEGLPPVFQEFVSIITSMNADDEPPYE